MADGTAENTDNNEFVPTVRWVIPQRLDIMTFIGKDVLAVAHDIYIIFLNLRTNTESVYVASGEAAGDGVDAIAGHKSTIFAFAEKVKNARIFIMSYPSFSVLMELKDTEVNRYKGLCMLEGDLLAAFSGFPNYLVCVWSWRSGQRLLSLPTGVVRRRQIYAASRAHTLVCQCWGEGLVVWEVAQVYRRCLMMKRAKQEVTGWEVAAPPLVAVCWHMEGGLYALDPQANLLAVTSDGIGMVTAVEWPNEARGEQEPTMCALGHGLLLYGPDDMLRWLKKADQKWVVGWQHTLCDCVTRLVANATCDVVVAWTFSGHIYRITIDEDHIDAKLYAFKQRHITHMEVIAPNDEYVATMSSNGMLCIYELMSGNLVTVRYVVGAERHLAVSPVAPLLAVSSAAGANYGLALLRLAAEPAPPTAPAPPAPPAPAPPPAGAPSTAALPAEPAPEQAAPLQYSLIKHTSICLTHQVVSRLVFSPTGQELVASAMAAGHIFIYKVTQQYNLILIRYTEIGRGLADSFLMKVGNDMRSFNLVLFSDKYAIGERVVCINAETGKDNKFAGKMQGPYAKLIPLSTKDTLLAIPHLSRSFHILKLSGEKGITVSVKMGPIIDSGHDLKQFRGFRNNTVLITYSSDGTIIVRHPDAPPEYELKIVMCHRYDGGVRLARAGTGRRWVAALGRAGTLAALALAPGGLGGAPRRDPPPLQLFNHVANELIIIQPTEKNYLDLQEEKKVKEEALDYKKQRDEVVRSFQILKKQLVELLEENIRERPLHQLSLSEFNLHLEAKKERLKLAEKEREEIRLQTEAQIRAQDKVTEWIKRTCWDAMLTPRIKLLAIFSHYQVENYPVLPTQRDLWPELQQTEALRSVEMENDWDVFKPWEEMHEGAVTAVSTTGAAVTAGAYLGPESAVSMGEPRESQPNLAAAVEPEESATGEPYVLSGSNAHKFINIPHFVIPQTVAFSFLQMNWLQHIVKLNVQNMRLWFNKQFDELMTQKRREVGLVAERNSRLRFIIEELNKLSDLRNSFHHLLIVIQDPVWSQDEQPEKLIKVEPEECSIPPYISPSQIVIIPPDPGPKDDFRERALIEMMDGVLEKLWHEEIKKPIPKPQCMLDKSPEHFNEDDLRQVFEYEAKVEFRNEERNKYRKMLHAEYAKLSQILNEGIVKFNLKVKELWLTKLRVDSVIGQENLSLMRLRRANLDRVEAAENLEDMRKEIGELETSIEELSREMTIIQEQACECQSMYDALAQKDRQMDRTFKNNFADFSSIVVDQCYKYFKRRPKWHQRASMTSGVLYELASAVLAGVRPPLLHPDCIEYFKGVEQLDQISNMPQMLDEGLWASVCRLRRVKIENEIRMRGVVLEMGGVEAAGAGWGRALAARRARLAQVHARVLAHRDQLQHAATNRSLQLVLPAGQVEIVSSGHMEDFDDATLIPREEIEKINRLILRIGAIKLRMMRKQMEFRKTILAKEWEHAQMKMKLRHMQQELYSYGRLKIPKELQWYLKGKEKGHTDEMDYQRLEKEMAATKMSFSRVLAEHIQRAEELEVRISAVTAADTQLDKLISSLNVKVSEKRINEDPLEPIRIRRVLKKRMETLVLRSHLIREVQTNHTTIVLLQTELELLRLKTFPTLASFRTFC